MSLRKTFNLSGFPYLSLKLLINFADSNFMSGLGVL